MANLYSFIVLILSITIHEFSHALVADRLGDPTPRSYGRLTLNPLAHADLLGTFILPLLSALTGIPTIGWAKPVPIDPFNFRHPKRDENLVALAGPTSNLCLALIFIGLAHLVGSNFTGLFIYPVIINLSLAVFNLIPIPPLDGSHLLFNFLPPESSAQWQEALSRYGYIILLALIFLPVGGGNILGLIINPVISLFFRLFP